MEEFRFAPEYELPRWPFVPPPELDSDAVQRHPIVIVGAGPAGLTLACDLAQRGVRALLLDEDDTVGVRGASSRGICHAQKSLEIFERLGIYQRIADKGITWSFGRTFSGNTEVYNFNLQASSVSAQPPFINLQQFYVEWFLVDRILELGGVDLRWKNRVTHVVPGDDGVRLEVETPAGSYAIEADWLIDATGANSPIRTQLGLEAHASRSTDRWCISDVRFKKPLPVERWTWVDAPFNEGRAVWQHLMADGVWRIDYQMPEGCDPAHISKPEVAGARLREQLGPGVEFEFVWIGPYGYRDHLLERFRHGRLFFIGDSAHVVSPFGARGGNSGIQDAANLGWKLALVTQGRAGEALLDTYDAERRPAAAQNLQVTSRTARFLAPRTPAEHTMRRAVMALASQHPFARALVNTGRMSVANDYPAGPHLPEGGRSVQNLPLRWRDGQPCTLMQLLAEGTHCLGLWFAPTQEQVRAVADTAVSLPLRLVAIGGDGGLPTLEPTEALAKHLGADAPGSLCLVRPDAYRAAVLRDPTPAALAAAIHTALAHD
ncbi:MULTISPECIES: FAD-dependent oxidoreductase [unclassified Variovorax]|uniref:FAD-dependent oxidoreductase n=1 Tax=unclassified Variovorax TaxID=663243 RepID=UPI00076C6044|nr:MULTISPECIES: FAD-dependent oxidoreductase [unclassified Variovorax]KWT85670.1 2-polyprenyl-6-methoxyphenol hydroxylase [Variovorax sp. WDL1]PNG58299.1 Anhydrotetracycline monooxygenase [Variovorax sp. B4]PNG61911.1 Anhydrotetracycline monooxygenase [Variovorax sp. B2]VTV12011.1 3-(3-hydroxy-phenyl)propionate/3-hydroxycinnamic acid hydroxylase [Variovorax sp. WDL1]